MPNSVIVFIIGLVIGALLLNILTSSTLSSSIPTANVFGTTSAPANIAANSTQNTTTPYLSQQQLQGIFGNGTYSKTSVKGSGVTIGAVPFTSNTQISDIKAAYVVDYNITTSNSLRFQEYVFVTPQANFLFTQFALLLRSSQSPVNDTPLVSTNGFQYFDFSNYYVKTTQTNAGGVVGQTSDFIVEITCRGNINVTCTNQNIADALQAISSN